MAVALTTNEIKHRSISGAKWLVIMNCLGMPAAFLIALMLGRLGPEALGVYALVQILIGVVTTFVVYGGPQVLSVFLPKISETEARGRFMFSYLVILVSFMFVMLALFWLFPKVFVLLLQRKFNMNNYGWFILLSCVIVATETFANAASGLMLIKVAAIARQMMRTVLLPLVATLFFFKREILINHGMPCILGGFLVGYMIACAVSLIGISRDPRFAMQPGWSLPRGFWAFSLTTMATTVFSFLYGNFDRMAILSIQDVKGLGMYQAVLSINTLLETIPAILQSTAIPTFSNLLNTNNRSTFDRAFAMLSRWTVVTMTLSALAIMGFSYEILGLFGESYVKYAYLLTMFGLVSIVRSLSLSTYTIVNCMEKNKFIFLQTLLMIVAQCILTLLYMARYGVIAIAGAKMLCVSCSAIVGVVYVFYGLGIGGKVPIAYKAALMSGTIMTILRIWFVPAGGIAATLLTTSCAALFLALSKFNFDEIPKIVRIVTHGDGGTLGKPL